MIARHHSEDSNMVQFFRLYRRGIIDPVAVAKSKDSMHDNISHAVDKLLHHARLIAS